MSRARDLADAGSKANFLDNVTANVPADVQTLLDAKAPLASPDFTGTVDLTGTTISLDNDQISGDKVSGGTIGAGTFNGTIGASATHQDGTILEIKHTSIAPYTSTKNSNSSSSPWTVRAKTSIAIASGNSLIAQLVVPELHANNTAGYMGLPMSISTSDPGSTVTSVEQGISYWEGSNNADTAIMYNHSLAGRTTFTSLLKASNPGANTYYVWFISVNNGLETVTHSVGVNSRATLVLYHVKGVI